MIQVCIFKRKCKFWKNCNCFDNTNEVCTKTGGDFYGPNRQGGCYRSLEEKGKLSNYWLSSNSKMDS